MRQWLALPVLVLAVVALACAPAPAAPQPAAQPAKPAVPQAAAPPQAAPQAAAPQPAKPAAERAKPAAPAAQPAKPAAEPAKPAAAAPGQKLRIIFGSPPIGSGYYTQYVALARLWNTKVPEVEVTNAEGGGCFDHLKRMESAQFLIAVGCPDLGFRAWQGLDEFKDKPVQVQRFLFVHSVSPQGWVVRRDTNITKIEELGGKDFTAGVKGSATEKQTLNVMEALDIKPRYYNAGVQDMIQAAKDRRIVGFAHLHGGERTIGQPVMEVHLITPLRELGFTPEQEKKIMEKYPYYQFMAVEKDQLAQGYPDRAIRTLALVVGVGIHKDVPEDLAYKLTKIAIEDNTDKGEKVQATAFGGVKGADFAQLTVDTVMTPLHAGAVKYLKEIGKQIKKEQMPPEMK